MRSGGSERILRPSASIGSASSSGRSVAAWGRSVSGLYCLWVDYSGSITHGGLASRPNDNACAHSEQTRLSDGWLVATDSQFDYSRPARTLLEASARRLAQHARIDNDVHDPADSAAAEQTALIAHFMAAYAAAAAAGSADWATSSEVTNMFAEDAVLVTQDKQVFRGRQQALRRLDQGTVPCHCLRLPDLPQK